MASYQPWFVADTTLTSERHFEVNGAPLLLNFAPNILAKTAVKARAIVENAFIKYYEEGGLNQASALAKARFAPPSAYGLSIQDSARLEVPLLFGVLSTSVPAAFWNLGRFTQKRICLLNYGLKYPPSFPLGMERGHLIWSSPCLLKSSRRNAPFSYQFIKRSCAREPSTPPYVWC